MSTKVQIPGTHIKSWAWPHTSVTLALREVEKSESLEIAELHLAPVSVKDSLQEQCRE